MNISGRNNSLDIMEYLEMYADPGFIYCIVINWLWYDLSLVPSSFYTVSCRKFGVVALVLQLGNIAEKARRR